MIIPFSIFNFSAFMNSYIPVFDIGIEDGEIMFFIPSFMECIYSIPYKLAYRKYNKIK